jgi:hypothetical protein
LSGSSRTTGKQVFLYANPWDDAIPLARMAVALGRWFCGVEDEALIVPECQGPGATFIKELKEIGYHHIYRRVVADEKVDKRTKKIGWFTPRDGVGGILSELIDACVRKEAEIRSELIFAQIAEYVWKDGKIVHKASVSKLDASHGVSTHGDCAVAAALSLVGVKSKPRKAVVVHTKTPAKYGSDEWLDKYLENRAAAERTNDLFNFADVA